MTVINKKPKKAWNKIPDSISGYFPENESRKTEIQQWSAFSHTFVVDWQIPAEKKR